MDVLLGDVPQCPEHCSPHVWKVPESVASQLRFDPGKHKEVTDCQVWRIGGVCHHVNVALPYQCQGQDGGVAWGIVVMQEESAVTIGHLPKVGPFAANVLFEPPEYRAVGFCVDGGSGCGKLSQDGPLLVQEEGQHALFGQSLPQGFGGPG